MIVFWGVWGVIVLLLVVLPLTITILAEHRDKQKRILNEHIEGQGTSGTETVETLFLEDDRDPVS